MRILISLFLVFGVALLLYLQGSDGKPVQSDSALSNLTSTEMQSNIVFDISVHNVEQLRDILLRAEKIALEPRSATQPATISIMLHGREIEYFTIDHYSQYRDIVDLAAKLDAYNVIEFKMCETAMKDFGIKKSNIPGFIEFVPNADVEIKELARKGYVIM